MFYQGFRNICLISRDFKFCVSGTTVSISQSQEYWEAFCSNAKYFLTSDIEIQIWNRNRHLPVLPEPWYNMVLIFPKSWT